MDSLPYVIFFFFRNILSYNNISVSGVHDLAKSLEKRWKGYIVRVCNDVQVGLGHITIHDEECNELPYNQLLNFRKSYTRLKSIFLLIVD